MFKNIIAIFFRPLLYINIFNTGIYIKDSINIYNFINQLVRNRSLIDLVGSYLLLLQLLDFHFLKPFFKL